MSPITTALVAVFMFSGAPALENAIPSFENEVSVATTTAIALSKTEFTPVEEGFTATVKLTSYNAVPEQTDGDPMTTASGAFSNTEVVAARSVDLKGDLPWGTVIKLSRAGEDSENCRFNAVSHLIGYRVIADSMHSRKREQIDILLDAADTVPVHGKEVNPSLALGLCSGVTIEVVGHLNIKEIPDTQEELVALVEGKALARR